MKKTKYFIQFILIIFLYSLYKIIGLKSSQKISSYIFSLLGPFFRSKKITQNNLSKAFPLITETEKKKIIKKMWINYGKIFSEYSFINNFRISKLNELISIENQDYLKEIKISKDPVVFISGHFNNFELMAMCIEKFGIDLAAIYRPLNNEFLNPLMEKIRKKYICRKQVKKGMSGTREILRHFKNGTSIALMIDQRVSQGVKTNFFGHEALTTTIPAQFVKKFNAKIVPIYIERTINNSFRLKIYKKLEFDKNENISSITLKLNKILEQMILKNPDQWIWTHNRWK
jgi:Kdo2-lipid IVA lauroyltransferase/acyltransferase